MHTVVDDSLKLSWSSKGFPSSTDYAALSPSSAKLFAEDPHKFYLRKVQKLDEPFSVPLAVGIAGHTGMETFLEMAYQRSKAFDVAAKEGLRAAADELAEHWEKVEDKSVRENPTRPESPRGRERVELTADEMEERLADVLWHSFCSIDEFADVYSVFSAQQSPVDIEASVGRLAEKHDRPSHIITSYDPTIGTYGEMPVGVIGGVPIRGRVDLVANWPGGGKMILDHKTVSKVVSYYPPYGGSGSWKMYEPSYNAADSLQLDMYAFASGIPRAGFQFMLRRPQYEPTDGRPLYPDWIDEQDWEDFPDLLPAAFVDGNDGLRQLCVWRPMPGDHPETPDDFSLDAIERRVTVKVRQIAEAMTESLVLYDQGAEPDIAFPAGDPAEIAKKACPYCHFQDTGDCHSPRDVDGAAEDYREVHEIREDLCRSSRRIMKLRKHWKRATEFDYPHLFADLH